MAARAAPRGRSASTKLARYHREDRWRDEAISTGRTLRGPRLLCCARNDTCRNDGCREFRRVVVVHTLADHHLPAAERLGILRLSPLLLWSRQRHRPVDPAVRAVLAGGGVRRPLLGLVRLVVVALYRGIVTGGRRQVAARRCVDTA